VFSPLILRGQTYNYQVSFHNVDPFPLPPCGDNPYEGFYGDFEMQHIVGAECGTYFITVFSNDLIEKEVRKFVRQ